jgi:hypothetical protein
MLALTTAQLVDVIFLLVALVVPVWLIIRFNIVGLILGALFFWVVLILCYELLNQLDPKRDRAIHDALWLGVGWFGGLMYCLPIYGIKCLALWLRRRRAACRAEPGQS